MGRSVSSSSRQEVIVDVVTTSVQKMTCRPVPTPCGENQDKEENQGRPETTLIPRHIRKRRRRLEARQGELTCDAWRRLLEDCHAFYPGYFSSRSTLMIKQTALSHGLS